MRGVGGEKVLAEEGRARRGETVGRAAGTLKFKAANFWIRLSANSTLLLLVPNFRPPDPLK